MEKLAENHEYITPSLAKKHGISKSKFYQYVNYANLEQVSHGIYLSKEEWVDELYVIHKKYPTAIFSHDEAFYYYGLSDREPLLHTLTVYSGYNAHRLKKRGDCKVYSVKKDLLEVGKTQVTTSLGHTIPMYDLERTICDLIRSRNSIEIQEFTTVLKNYVQRNDKDLNKLMNYAKLFRVNNIILRYMEVLL